MAEVALLPPNTLSQRQMLEAQAAALLAEINLSKKASTSDFFFSGEIYGAQLAFQATAGGISCSMRRRRGDQHCQLSSGCSPYKPAEPS